MMLLSEAIRLGAMLKPQAFDLIFDGVGTCVFGAALDAVGELPKQRTVVGIGMAFDKHPHWRIYFDCPECQDKKRDASHLNDYHRWTREEIADWVEGLERERGLIAQAESMLDVLEEIKR